MSEKEVKKVEKKKVDKTKAKTQKSTNVLATLKSKVGTDEILKATVSIVEHDKALDSDVLIVKYKGVKGVIKKDDVDMDLTLNNLTNFVGREVSFVIKGVDEKEKYFIASRKEAQGLLREKTLKRLYDGEAFVAQIINILPHGSYVEVDGVTGLLKNTDFAEDFTTIEELYSQGDKINVKLKKVSSNGNLLFEATRKYCNPSTVRAEDLKEGQTVLGVIRSIKPFGIFVNVAPFLDVLCSLDAEEYEEDKKVQVLIEDIKDAEFNGAVIKRYKGKIVRVL